MDGIKCSRCRHLMVTWVPATPYGCSAWGIRSRRHPCLVVYSSSGAECQLFEPKESVSKRLPADKRI